MERAAPADALAVLLGIGADNLFRLHLDPQVLPGEVRRREDRQEGIPLAAAGAADLSDLFQRPGGHPVGEAERFGAERGGPGGDGNKHPGADSGAAGAPEPAGPAGDAAAAALHFGEGFRQVQLPSGVMVGGQQRGPDHHMVLRAVHMAERGRHQLLQNPDGVFGRLLEAEGEDAVHPLGVALVADVMFVDTPGFAGLPLVAEGAFHYLVLL